MPRKRKSVPQQEETNNCIDLTFKYRPKSIDEFFGNSILKKSLKTLIDKQKIPQQILFYGDKGCGKTSLARICASELQCSEFDLKEIDTADFRGIDTVRELRRIMGTQPMKGSVKVYILDECFAPGTEIKQSDGSIKFIEQCLPNDLIYSLHGKDIIEAVSKNKVSLDRVVKLKFNNGSILYTTKDHVFYTEQGEINAINLTQDHLTLCFNFNNSSLDSELTPKEKYYEEFNSKKKEVCLLQSIDRNKEQGKSKILQKETNLFKILCFLFKSKKKRTGQICKQNLRMVRETIQNQRNCFFSKILFNKMFGKIQSFTKRICVENGKMSDLFYSIRTKRKKSKTLFKKMRFDFYGKEKDNQLSCLSKRNHINDKRYTQILFESLFRNIKNWKITIRRNTSKNWNEVPWKKTFKRNSEKNLIEIEKNLSRTSRNYRKSETNKSNEWNFTYLDWNTWWKWAIDRIPNYSSECFAMGNGSSYFFREATEGIPNELQSRYRECSFKNSNRSGWEKTQQFKTKEFGFEKRIKTKTTRLESIEIYKRGSNDKSFSSIIGDKERDQNYVIFYDLQVKNHPSYFANEIAVHNCHMLGRGGDSSKNEAQNALLKALEEPPKHVYFFLCTTDPQNLLSTIRSRCVQYKVSPLAPKQIVDLLNHICDEEDLPLSKKVALQIAKEVKGVPRNAIKTLQKIIHLEEDEQLKIIEEVAKNEEFTFNLCRALTQNKSWKEISSMLQNITEEPEASRRIIRKYFTTALLNGNTSAYIVLDVLKTPFYNTDAYNELVRCVFEIHTELNT